MKISIIIPTLNEAEHIDDLLHHLPQNSDAANITEIIVVDGGSGDETIAIAQEAGAEVIFSGKGRARQMNAGARVAIGDVLYFLHADTYPPSNFDGCILQAIHETYGGGSFSHSFDDTHPVLRFTSWLVNHVPRVRLGDQSLFVRRELFEGVGGFDETLIIMEDADIVRRLKAHTRFKVVDCTVVTSARKFHENGALRLLLIFILIFVLYEGGVSQERLLQLYQRLIRQDKI